MIHVPDVRATVAWYESIGFKVVATYGHETGDNFSFAIVSFGDSEVMFNTNGKPSDEWRREVDLYVYTDNVDELYETLKDRVDVVEGPQDKFYGMREVIIRDLNRLDHVWSGKPVCDVDERHLRRRFGTCSQSN